MANPIRMTYPEGIEKIRGEYKIAREQSEHMTAFSHEVSGRLGTGQRRRLYGYG